MLDHWSPLAPLCVPGRHGNPSGDPVRIGTRNLRSLWQLAGWDNFAAASEAALDFVGLSGLGDYRTARQSGDVTCWRIAPDRLLLEGAGDLTGFASADLAVLDLSHARTVITLEGPQARLLLSHLCAVDVDADAFAPGQFMQTGMEQFAVLLQCVTDTSFEITVPVTWAETLWDAICHNAEPFGYEFQA